MNEPRDKELECIACPTCDGVGDVPVPVPSGFSPTYREWKRRLALKHSMIVCQNCEGTGHVWEKRRQPIMFANMGMYQPMSTWGCTQRPR